MSSKKRLHPVAIFFLIFAVIREFFIPIAAAFIFGRQATPFHLPFWIQFLLLVILLFVFGLLKWITFTYEVTEDELKVKQGIFVKKHRFIRKERIYSIDLTAGIFQRMFGLVKVRLETAGGGTEPEVTLSAVKREEALTLKSLLLPQIEVEMVENRVEEELHVKWSLSQRDLALTSLTSTGVGFAFMALLAVVTQIEEFLSDDLLVDSFGYLFQVGWLMIVILFLFLALLAWIISIVGTYLKYGGFSIVKNGDEIEISRGLLEKRQLTLSLNRITAIRLVETILRQPFGFVTVYVESAGGGTKDEQLSTVLIPLIRKRDVQMRLKQIIPDVSFEFMVEPLPKKARIRYIIRMLFPAILIGALLVFLLPVYGIFLGLTIIGLAFFIGNLKFKDSGVGNNTIFYWISYRTISKTLVIIPKKRIQALEIKQSPMQKLRDLYTIRLSILTSVFGKSFQAVDVSPKQIEDIMDWYSYEKNAKT